MKPAYVWSQAAWMPGLRGVEAVLAGGEPDPAATNPDISTFPSRLMRGTSPTTRMIVATARDAMRAAGAEMKSTVVGSAFGEISIALKQLEMMLTGDGKVSPAAFKNSVHNTAAGVLSVADGNMSPSTALAAGEMTVGYSLLEGMLQLADGVPMLVVAVGDEQLPPPLSQRGDWPHFAAAWVLGAAPPPGPCMAIESVEPCEAETLEVPPALATHPCRSAWAVLQAVHQRREGTMRLATEDGLNLGITLRAVAGGEA